MVVVELDVTGDVPEGEVEQARAILSELDRLPVPPDAVRVLVRPTMAGIARPPYVADGRMPLATGHHLSAHAIGETPHDAVHAVRDRLALQLRRRTLISVATRVEPESVRAAVQELRGTERPRPRRIKPPEERRIAHRRFYPNRPQSTLEAAADLLDEDEEFRLFVHAGTHEDVAVFWREDEQLGLLHPQGSPLANENDLVIPQPNRYAKPLAFEDARREMDVLDHTWLFFVDADDGRGKALYLRHDGDYGLVEPERDGVSS